MRLLVGFVLLATCNWYCSLAQSYFDKDDVVHGGIKMGVVDSTCDDGKTGTNIDWDEASDTEYFCSDNDKIDLCTADKCLKPSYSLNEKSNGALHKCMSSAIEYSADIPTSGSHRPIWPAWGRYIYVPPQRWIHSLEHGGVVALYHPCLPSESIEEFANLISSCLYRHVISPYNMLSQRRPFVLVTWRNKVEFSTVDKGLMSTFIKQTALKGPEAIAKSGHYKLGLLEAAKIVTNAKDSGGLCPRS